MRDRGERRWDTWLLMSDALRSRFLSGIAAAATAKAGPELARM
jgi:hypothetical protein